MARRLLVLAVACACCTDATKPMQTVAPPPPPPPAAELSGFPLARLVVDGNPVVALDHPLAEDRLAALAARSYRAFTATAPRVWLLVFEFSDQAALLAALPRIDELLGDDDAPPYYRRPVYTGAWLLVTGFPSHKPVSPEMEAARAAFVARWAGEE